MRLLLIEDDRKIALFVKTGLKEAGFAVDHVVDGEDGLHLALTEPYDLAVIDLMLPTVDGLTIIKEMRKQEIDTPVLILSAKRTLNERIKGLQTGGDDYLVVERGKIGLRGESLRQNSFHFPRDRWVELKWVLDLSPTEDGRAELYLDGQQILAASGINMPNADIFAQLGEENGIDFTLQEPVYYERIQVGVTANSGVDSVHLFVDDVSVVVSSGTAVSR